MAFLENKIDDKDFLQFVQEIKQKIAQSQYHALQSINKELIMLYNEIGKMIVQRQEQFGWGKGIVKNLSQILQAEFTGIKGFSAQNLWNMRQFYLSYQHNEKLQTLPREIFGRIMCLFFKNVKMTCKESFTLGVFPALIGVIGY